MVLAALLNKKALLHTHFMISHISGLETGLIKEIPITSFMTVVNTYNSLQNRALHGYEGATCSQSILGPRIELFIYSQKTLTYNKTCFLFKNNEIRHKVEHTE